jgi:hypothetical protein
MAILSSIRTSPNIPRTRLWLRPSPLQHFQMTIHSSIRTCFLIPGTRLCLRPSPLQHFQMIIQSRIRTCPLIPGTRLRLRPSPLQHFQMTSLSSIRTCQLIPETPAGTEPTAALPDVHSKQHTHMSTHPRDKAVQETGDTAILINAQPRLPNDRHFKDPTFQYCARAAHPCSVATPECLYAHPSQQAR